MLCLIASKEALIDSGLNEENLKKNSCGVVIGAGAGGMHTAEQYRTDLILKGLKKAHPSMMIPFPTATTTDYIANEFNLTGYRNTIVTACSSSTSSVGNGFDQIRFGREKIMLVGGCESLCKLTYSGFNALKNVDPDPCKPFDKNRKGLSLGEGASVLVLEEEEFAKKKKCKNLCKSFRLGY